MSITFSQTCKIISQLDYDVVEISQTILVKVYKVLADAKEFSLDELLSKADVTLDD